MWNIPKYRRRVVQLRLGLKSRVDDDEVMFASRGKAPVTLGKLPENIASERMPGEINHPDISFARTGGSFAQLSAPDSSAVYTSIRRLKLPRSQNLCRGSRS